MSDQKDEMRAEILCRPFVVRTWEFDARDEGDVRRLFREAKEQGVENVMGFNIRSIEAMSAEGGSK